LFGICRPPILLTADAVALPSHSFGGVMCAPRSCSEKAFDVVVMLYRSLSAASLASAAFCLFVHPGGSNWDTWKVVSVYGSGLSLLVIISAVFLGVIVGSIGVTLRIKPSRSVAWCVLANVFALLCALLTPSI
jgi:hypothetical protein